MDRFLCVPPTLKALFMWHFYPSNTLMYICHSCSQILNTMLVNSLLISALWKKMFLIYKQSSSQINRPTRNKSFSYLTSKQSALFYWVSGYQTLSRVWCWSSLGQLSWGTPVFKPRKPWVVRLRFHGYHGIAPGYLLFVSTQERRLLCSGGGGRG